MELELNGKAFIVSGGTRGIGRAVVEALLAEGASVVFCGRSESGVQDTISRNQKNALLGVVGDITEPEFVDELVIQAKGRFGHIDGLVANVGGSRGNSSIVDSTWCEWSDTFGINVGHSLGVLKAILPELTSSACASVVFVASISGWKPAPTIQYGAAKAALIYTGQALARQLATHGVRVNVVSPGSVYSRNGPWERLQQSNGIKYNNFVAENFPAGRMGTPEEIANVIVFLLSNRASWINGAHIAVDGAQDRPTALPWS